MSVLFLISPASTPCRIDSVTDFRILATVLSRQLPIDAPGLTKRARFISSGRAQLFRLFQSSHHGLYCLSQPGGHGLSALSVLSSVRGMTKCNS